jgi:hypothetical protein
MAAFIPGASPPLVNTAIRFMRPPLRLKQFASPPHRKDIGEPGWERVAPKR